MTTTSNVCTMSFLLLDPEAGDMDAQAGAQPRRERRDIAQQQRRMLREAQQPERGRHGDAHRDRNREVPRQEVVQDGVQEDREEAREERPGDEEEDAPCDERELQSLAARHRGLRCPATGAPGPRALPSSPPARAPPRARRLCGGRRKAPGSSSAAPPPGRSPPPRAPWWRA